LINEGRKLRLAGGGRYTEPRHSDPRYDGEGYRREHHDRGYGGHHGKRKRGGFLGDLFD
jgi:hypothetical protein